MVFVFSCQTNRGVVIENQEIPYIVTATHIVGNPYWNSKTNMEYIYVKFWLALIQFPTFCITMCLSLGHICSPLSVFLQQLILQFYLYATKVFTKKQYRNKLFRKFYNNWQNEDWCFLHQKVSVSLKP